MYARAEAGAVAVEIIVDRRELLRIKVKSLAAEARIIRAEEQKSSGQLRTEMHQHRTQDLRIEARASSLALGFIKGRSLEEMEVLRATFLPVEKLAWDRVMVKVDAMIKKYGPANFVKAQEPTEARKAKQERGRLKVEMLRKARTEYNPHGKYLGTEKQIEGALKAMVKVTE
jgi:hypothetical protein